MAYYPLAQNVILVFRQTKWKIKSVILHAQDKWPRNYGKNWMLPAKPGPL